LLYIGLLRNQLWNIRCKHWKVSGSVCFRRRGNMCA